MNRRCVSISVFTCIGFAALVVGDRPAESQQHWSQFVNSSGMCLDVRGGQAGGAANETPVQIFQCNNTPAQQWSFQQGTFHNHLGRCLDVQGGQAGGARNGTPVQIYDCNGTPAQRWSYDGTSLRNSLGRCLDVPGGNMTAGTGLGIYDCNNTPAQHWTLR